MLRFAMANATLRERYTQHDKTGSFILWLTLKDGSCSKFFNLKSKIFYLQSLTLLCTILQTVHSLKKDGTPLQTSPVLNVIPFPSPLRRGLGRGFKLVLCVIKKSKF
ncbi:hypothetical protein AA650_07580 [Anabaena sp. WA102]|jgi:hypothetical protein|nr:hypothetical protein AA650_07580 [Anabaena sp. WA102]